YLGCFTDAIPRVLNRKTENHAQMTRERCVAFFDGYKFYGVQYSTHCFCGDSFENPSKSTPESECNGKCGGSGDMCGAYARSSVFVK
ncbi:hypothetical protein COCC4DRAFT_107207, partial [Bipolaris maydis ATCC 48331]